MNCGQILLGLCVIFSYYIEWIFPELSTSLLIASDTLWRRWLSSRNYIKYRYNLVWHPGCFFSGELGLNSASCAILIRNLLGDTVRTW